MIVLCLHLMLDFVSFNSMIVLDCWNHLCRDFLRAECKCVCVGGGKLDRQSKSVLNKLDTMSKKDACLTKWVDLLLAK